MQTSAEPRRMPSAAEARRPPAVAIRHGGRLPRVAVAVRGGLLLAAVRSPVGGPASTIFLIF
jgi:hypothetical protein